MTRNVSQFGVYVETSPAVAIPLFRLVQFQLERQTDVDHLPGSLRQGRVLSAVYRVQPATPNGTPQGLALRLMIDPRGIAARVDSIERATA